MDDTAGDGGVLVSLVFLGASVAIGFFGLRYLMLGVRGSAVKFYERAVEADFQRGLAPIPVRRTVPLLHIRVSGSSRLTTATAITTTGHAFRLPAALVERSDIWYLGSLGTSPIAPGGRGAKERYEEGEMTPYAHPASDPLPDHGPPYPDPGSLPITVDVDVEPEKEPEPPVPVEPLAPPVVPTPAPTAPAGWEPEVPPPVTRAPPAPSPEPEEKEMEVLMDLPDVIEPPETRERSIPPPPRYRPPSIRIPEPPKHREMDREGLEEPEEETVPPSTPELEPIPAPEHAPEPAPASEPAPVPEPAFELMPTPTPEPPPERQPEPVPEPAPAPPSDDWELEELPPPEGDKKKPTSPSGGDWEEM